MQKLYEQGTGVAAKLTPLGRQSLRRYWPRVIMGDIPCCSSLQATSYKPSNLLHHFSVSSRSGNDVNKEYVPQSCEGGYTLVPTCSQHKILVQEPIPTHGGIESWMSKLTVRNFAIRPFNCLQMRRLCDRPLDVSRSNIWPSSHAAFFVSTQKSLDSTKLGLIQTHLIQMDSSCTSPRKTDTVGYKDHS